MNESKGLPVGCIRVTNNSKGLWDVYFDDVYQGEVRCFEYSQTSEIRFDGGPWRRFVHCVVECQIQPTMPGGG